MSEPNEPNVVEQVLTFRRRNPVWFWAIGITLAVCAPTGFLFHGFVMLFLVWIGQGVWRLVAQKDKDLTR